MKWTVMAPAIVIAGGLCICCVLAFRRPRKLVRGSRADLAMRRHELEEAIAQRLETLNSDRLRKGRERSPLVKKFKRSGKAE